MAKFANPIWLKVYIDIKTALPMERSLLIFHSRDDKLIPDGKEHADTFMKWAEGEKELKYYPDGVHVCANYLGVTDAFMIDWLRKQSVKEIDPWNTTLGV